MNLLFFVILCSMSRGLLTWLHHERLGVQQTYEPLVNQRKHAGK